MVAEYQVNAYVVFGYYVNAEGDARQSELPGGARVPEISGRRRFACLNEPIMQ
jgi:hypothetical protein